MIHADNVEIKQMNLAQSVMEKTTHKDPIYPSNSNSYNGDSSSGNESNKRNVGPRCRHCHEEDNVLLDDEDSGCECGVDELEGMDAWTKTLVAIKVLTAFKKRRKKKLEQEKLRKERRKTLWKRLGFKLRVFNIFANKLYNTNDDPTVEKFDKLKRKLGTLRKNKYLIFFYLS